MPSSKILVLGATGPAGICLLRELLHRNHTIIAYARNPQKIPSDLTYNTHLSIIKGEMNDRKAFSAALQGCSAVISHLGAQIRDTHIAPTLYADIYRDTILPAMRAQGVKRILLMGTLAIQRPEDAWTFSRPLILVYLKLFARAVYRNILNVAALFEDEAKDVDWTVFRIASIPGEADAESWRKERGEGEVFVGPVGARGWGLSTNRSLLARWLVDVVEGEEGKWVREMPAVSRLVS